MFDDKVVILHALYVSHNALINVMGFFVVLQIFVIGEYCGFVWGTE